MAMVFQHPAAETMRKAAVRYGKRLLYLSLFILLAGLLMIILAFNSYIQITILGLAVFITGLLVLNKWNKIKAQGEPPVLNILLNEPHRIVWVYTYETKVMPYGVSLFRRTYLIVKLDDGSELSFRIPYRKRAMIIDWLNRVLPRASFGYSKEKEIFFLEDPKLLLMQNRDSGGSMN